MWSHLSHSPSHPSQKTNANRTIHIQRANRLRFSSFFFCVCLRLLLRIRCMCVYEWFWTLSIASFGFFVLFKRYSFHTFAVIVAIVCVWMQSGKDNYHYCLPIPVSISLCLPSTGESFAHWKKSIFSEFRFPSSMWNLSVFFLLLILILMQSSVHADEIITNFLWHEIVRTGETRCSFVRWLRACVTI